MFLGLALATVGAILAFDREWGGYVFADPKTVAVLVGVSFAWFFRSDWKHSMKLNLAVIVYCLGLIPGLMYTKDLRMSLFGFGDAQTGGVLASLLCASGLLLAYSLPEKDKLKKVVKACGVIASVLCLTQYFHADPYHFGKMPLDKAIGTMGSRIDMGALFVTMFSFYYNPIYLIGVATTGSRGAWVGCLVAMFPVRFRLYAFAVASVACMTLTMMSDKPKDLGRVDVWRVAATEISFTGTGPSTFFHTYDKKRNMGMPELGKKYTQAYAHNTVLEYATTKGVLGIMSLSAFLVAPEIAGLYTVCMFNPVSFPVIFVACVLVGLYWKEDYVVPFEVNRPSWWENV